MKETETEEKPRLHVYEWAAILSIVGFLLLICFLTQGPGRWALSERVPNDKSKSLIPVRIDGAVENPGVYLISPQSTLEDALALAKPTPAANLTKFTLNARVKAGQRIKVPAFPQITIHLTGEVNAEMPLQIRKGTKLCDLPNLVTFPSTADLKGLGKKRRLKDGEKVHIPKKNT